MMCIVLLQVKPVKQLTVEKKIGGEKNGETRIVLLKKRRNYFPTADKYEPNMYFVTYKFFD
jgi:large subunit ribosomal protein L6e